eukprot:COSAG02_NODE_9967_length_2062_cov_0.905756_1_plen_65_part_10
MFLDRSKAPPEVLSTKSNIRLISSSLSLHYPHELPHELAYSECERFRENGFVVIKNALDASRLAR